MSKELVLSSLSIIICGLLGGLLLAYGLNNGIKENYIVGSTSIMFSILILLKGYDNLTLIFKRH